MRQCENVINGLSLTKEQALKQAQPEVKVGSWVYCCDTGDFWWSDEMYHIFNLRKSQEVTQELFLSLLYPADTEILVASYEKLKKGKHHKWVYRILVNGKERWIQNSGTFYGDDKAEQPYIAGSTFEIVRPHSEEDQDVIFSECIDMIATIDKKGTFVRVNPAGAAALGYDIGDMEGKQLFDFILEGERKEAKQMLKELLNNGVVKGHRNTYICKGGEAITLEMNAKYLKKKKYVIAVARNVTKQSNAEDRTLELEKSVALEKLKGEFFANLSHEFKTPLNIIISSLDLMSLKLCKDNEEVYNREYKKFISYAYQNCYKLLRLTTNLLDSTKIDNQFLRAQFGICQVVKLLEDITKSAEVYAGARGVSIHFTSDVDDNIDICCDMDQIDRILLNLISNAIKNTPSEGDIEVHFSEDEKFYIVSVKDNGIGISPGILPHIFDRFHSTDKGPMANHDGSGMGLSIVKSLVEMHGGTIKAESATDQGSKFTFTISKTLAQDGQSEFQLPSGMRYDFEARQSRVKMELSNI